MAEHIMKSFDGELRRLYGELKLMGELSSQQLAQACQVLLNRDNDAADVLIAADAKIDKLESLISHDVLRLLALRQPMAGDLREVYSALKITADIERVGDYAANIAKRSKILNQSKPMPAISALPALFALAGELMSEAMQAFLNQDVAAAERVRARDAELDALYTRLFREVLTYMAEDPRMITPGTHLLFIAKNIERIGDHATNIAESALFIVNGEAPGVRPKSDGTTS